MFFLILQQCKLIRKWNYTLLDSNEWYTICCIRTNVVIGFLCTKLNDHKVNACLLHFFLLAKQKPSVEIAFCTVVNAFKSRHKMTWIWDISTHSHISCLFPNGLNMFLTSMCKESKNLCLQNCVNWIECVKCVQKGFSTFLMIFNTHIDAMLNRLKFNNARNFHRI